jgi:hypothetical protein
MGNGDLRRAEFELVEHKLQDVVRLSQRAKAVK